MKRSVGRALPTARAPGSAGLLGLVLVVCASCASTSQTAFQSSVSRTRTGVQAVTCGTTDADEGVAAGVPSSLVDELADPESPETSESPTPSSSTTPTGSPSPTASPTPSASASPEPTPTPEPGLTPLEEATAFMNMMEAGNYAGQWPLLSPVAQEQWPSDAARAAMLEAKFHNDPVSGYTLGTESAGETWVSKETLSEVPGLIEIPVSVTFANPALLEPGRVAGYYASLDLFLTPATPDSSSEVVGEGPASLDAPVIIVQNPTPQVNHVPILMYHVVGPHIPRGDYASEYAYLLDYSLTVTPQEFAGQMDWMHANGFHAISLARLSDYLLYNLPLPSRPFVITIDDGRLGPYANAVPTLLDDGYTAAFFIPTELVGIVVPGHDYFSWSQIQTLNDEGFWMEDHSFKDNVDDFGDSVGGPTGLDEIAGVSKDTIEEYTGFPVQFIAYTGMWPYGSPADVGTEAERVFSVLVQMGYVGGVIDASENSNVVTSSNLWYLPRIRVNPGEGLGTFADELGTAAGVPVPWNSYSTGGGPTTSTPFSLPSPTPKCGPATTPSPATQSPGNASQTGDVRLSAGPAREV